MSGTERISFGRVKHRFYRDSVNLMRLSAILREIDGVEDIAVVMGTENNKRLLKEAGLITSEIQEAGSSDMCIAAKIQNVDVIEELQKNIEGFFDRGSDLEKDNQNLTTTNSLENAIVNQPDVNIALISVPGQYAAEEAERCLQKGINVFLFSDNVSLADEIKLKNLAVRKGLLMMGPDCGTSIIQGVPFGFANEVRRGNIGIVSASGTGLQEVSTLIHKKGGGISHAIGTGGRDLSKEVQGMASLFCVDLLLQDKETEVLVLISKPPAVEVGNKILNKVALSDKPIIVCYLGLGNEIEYGFDGFIASTLEEAAQVAVQFGNGISSDEDQEAPLPQRWADKIEKKIAKLGPDRKYVRGLFTGGTLADEAALILAERISPVWAVDDFGSIIKLPDGNISRENSIIDLGADEFTESRAHPMIDPRLRNQRLMHEILDDQVAVFLFDVVLGWGSHEDPGGVLAKSILEAKKQIKADSNEPIFICSVTGTDEDPQGYHNQVEKLKAAGVLVTDSNAQAADLAAWILERGLNE